MRVEFKGIKFDILHYNYIALQPQRHWWVWSQESSWKFFKIFVNSRKLSI